MGFPPYKYVAPQVYLEMEKVAFEKHEYIGGEIYAMAGATERHVRIVSNLTGEIHSFLKGKSCSEYPTDFRVATPILETYMYPDLSIVCGKAELKPDCFDTLTNPSAIFEVMSPSTEDRDKVLKFLFYRQIPSLKENDCP